MLTLYSGSGAQDFNMGLATYNDEQWRRIRASVLKTLERRGHDDSLRYFAAIPFRLFDANNFFGDEFTVLHADLPFEKYMEIADAIGEVGKFPFSAIADAVTEFVSPYVRFVTIDMDHGSGPDPVEEPTLEDPSATVEHALADARELLQSRGAVSAVDRVHTAFHGYLKSVCVDAKIPIGNDPPITAVFALLRKHHPKFAIAGPEADVVDRMARSLSAVVDSVNFVRNHASAAHANEDLLKEPEAMLVINSVRTLLHYVHAKLGAA